jgi:hypothetical protein
MVKEEHIIKIINNEFEKILKNVNNTSQNDNSGLSEQKIFLMKFYKNLELIKSNILLNLKNYFSNHNNNKPINMKMSQINQFTKLLRSKKRNKSQNILNFQTNLNMNQRNKKNLFYSVIDGSSSELKNNNSYLSPASNKKKIQIKPIVSDIKNFRIYKSKNINNNLNINSNTISCMNNLNANNSNIIHNPFNINNIISSEEGEQDIKVIFSKKSVYMKKNINYMLNKSNSELKLKVKDKKSNYSSNKVSHQKKKISLVDDIINNIGLFNKDNNNKNKKNLKIFTNTGNGDGKGEKNVSFSLNPSKNVTQSFWKNHKKKITINKINLQKLHFNTKTEVINKKKKMLKFSTNNFVNKNKNNTKMINNNSFKRTINKLSKNINHSFKANIYNNNNINNNSLNCNMLDNDDSINDNIADLAKEIIYFLDNLKNLQNSIIKKDSDTKKMKINFEMQKVSLYQKAKKILNLNLYKNNCNNNCNESKLNISNNSKGLNSTTVKSDSLSYIKNYFGNNMKNTLSGINIKKLNTNSENKENNTKKTIEETIKLNDEIYDKLKMEIKILNDRLNEKIQKDKINEKIISENLAKIINIYKYLLLYSNNKNKNDIYCNVPEDKKFDWYVHEINEIIEKSGKEWKIINDNIENNKINNINENLIKEQLYKTTVDIMKWLEPYMELKNDEIKKYIIQLEEDFNNYGIKQALNTLKSKIKELIYLLEINKINNKNVHIMSNINIYNIIDKDNFMKLNSVILNVQNNLMMEIEKKNKEISLTKDELNNSLKLNNKILNLISNYLPQETRIFQEKYDYLINLFNAEQDKVNLLQNEYMNVIEGLMDYIYNGNKITIELGKMWNIKPKKESNFELIEPDSSEMGHLSESDLLSTGSKKSKEVNSDLVKYKEEVEQYKKVFKYLENKMTKYDVLLNNIVNILIKIVKNLQMNDSQKELFFTLFRMLNIKDEKIVTFINNESKK